MQLLLRSLNSFSSHTFSQELKSRHPNYSVRPASIIFFFLGGGGGGDLLFRFRPSFKGWVETFY